MIKNKKILALIASILSVFMIGSLSNNLENVKTEASSDLLSTPTVSWNNVDYMKVGWCDVVNDLGIPQQGYCILFMYESNLASRQYIDTNILEMSIPGCNVSDHILINGEIAKNVTGTKIFIYPENGIFVYFPASSISISKQYKYPTVETIEGLTIDGSIKTVATRFEYRGNLGSFNNWVINPPQAQALPFNGIAPGWNNADYGTTPGFRNLILTFGQYNVDWLSSDHVANATNQATSAFDIGTGLTINGLTIAKIHEKEPDTKVSYEHGFCYLYIRYPLGVLELTKDYMVPTLHIEEGTEFMDIVLPEVTLKFSGGCWINSSNSEFKLENPIDSINHSMQTLPFKMPTFESKMILGDLSEEGCEIALNINTGDVDLSNGNSIIHFALYNITIQINQFAQTVELIYNNQTLQIFRGYQFSANSDYGIELKITCGTISKVQFAINHLLLIDYSINTNLYITESNLVLWMIDVLGTWTIDEYKELSYYSPKITYSGASIYDFMEGDPIYNFVSVVDAYSLYDENISSLNVIYQYEDGAVTNGKYNAGTWTLSIILDVDGYSSVSIEVTINVHGKLSLAKIRFDEGDVIEVPIGSKLTPPPNPSTYRDGEYDYVFDGWYFNGAKWDFENDVVEGDMNFYSRFKAINPHYIVSVNFVGVEKLSESYSLVNGSNLPFDVFEMEGATFVVYMNGQKINSLTVTGDITLTVEYTVYFTYVEPKEATCTEEGSTGYWYSEIYNGYAFADSLGKEIKPDGIIPKTGHNIVHLDYTDSTCSQVGNVDCYCCTNCLTHYKDIDGNEELSNWAIAKKPHVMSHHDAVDATCENIGNVEYWTCENEPNVYYGDNEGTIILENVVINALGHDYRAPTYEWISTDNGYKCIAKITCSHCHDEISETQEGEKVVVRESTCTREGQISYSARFNDLRFNAQTKIISLEKIPHNYVFVDEVKATSSSTGIKEHYECSSCHRCFVKNANQYDEIDYTDLIYTYNAKNKGCGGDINSTSLLIYMSAGALTLLTLLKRKEAK